MSKGESIEKYDNKLYISFDGNPLNIALGRFRFEESSRTKERPAQDENEKSKGKAGSFNYGKEIQPV